MNRTMTCRQTIEHMMDYIEGRLGANKRSALERHLGTCPRCEEFLRSYRATPDIVRRATAITISVASMRRVRMAVRARLTPRPTTRSARSVRSPRGATVPGRTPSDRRQ